MFERKSYINSIFNVLLKVVWKIEIIIYTCAEIQIISDSVLWKK